MITVVHTYLKKFNKILKHDHREQSMKVLISIYAETESLLEKIDTCHNNPEKSLTTKNQDNSIWLFIIHTLLI